MSTTRQIRQQPFCWQEKKILRLIQEKASGQEKAKLVALYATLTWLDSDFNGRPIKFYTKTINKRSGLSREWIPSGLKFLEDLNIIQIEENRKNGAYDSRTVYFTPEMIENVKDENSDVYPPKNGKNDGKPLNGKPFNRYRFNGEPAYIEDSILKEENSGLEFRPPEKDSFSDEAISSKKTSPEDEEVSWSSQEEFQPVDEATGDVASGRVGEQGEGGKGDTIGKQINDMIAIFQKSINPELAYGRKSTRDAAKELIERYGFEEAVGIAHAAVSIQGRPFAPVITSPYELREKLTRLKIFYKIEKEKSEKKCVGNWDEMMAHLNRPHPSPY